LHDGIGRQLMQLRLKVQQNVSQDRIQRHAQANDKKSSYTTASSLSGSGTVSSPGAWPSPYVK
jgi:hypothetical protein